MVEFSRICSLVEFTGLLGLLLFLKDGTLVPFAHWELSIIRGGIESAIAGTACPVGFPVK